MGSGLNGSPTRSRTLNAAGAAQADLPSELTTARIEFSRTLVTPNSGTVLSVTAAEKERVLYSFQGCVLTTSGRIFGCRTRVSS